MSEETIARLLAGMAQNNEIMVRQLLERLQPASNGGNLTKCTASFDGVNDDIESFIDTVSIYKECEQVSDDNALRGLPLLLTGQAATYWQGVKASVTTWNDALKELRSSFSKILPPHGIFRKMFSEGQLENESTELFISNKRALLSQLPYVLDERIQLDMVYGLLNKRNRNRISRQLVNSFPELLQAARNVQDFDEDNIFAKVETNRRRMRDGDAKESTTQGRGRKELRNEPEHLRQSAIKCYGCGNPGIIRPKCPNCSAKPSSSRESSFNVDVLQGSSSSETRPRVSINVIIIMGLAFLDTGATKSVMGVNLYNKLRGKINFLKQNISMTLADGSVKHRLIKCCTLNVTLENRCIETKFLLLNTRHENFTLLGMDFISKARLVFDFNIGNWYFGDSSKHRIDFTTNDQKGPRPRLVVNEKISAMSTLVLRPNEGSHLTVRQTEELNDFISNSCVFGQGGGFTTLAEHCIILEKNHAPISVPPYRMPLLKKELLKTELDRLLDQGIIEACESPWAAPVVLVPKKDGKIRLCVDYRRLNAITVSDKYPMPRIEDLIHQAKNTKFMTTLDMRAGYHQVKVRECDKDKTAFTTPFGIFRYIGMSFGLKNAPATFQRLIDSFRTGLPHILILAYLDDLIILSETFEKHLSDLHDVFRRLELYNLTLNRDKCVFACSTVKYLGHLITPNGISVDPVKVSAILEIPEPKNLKHLQSFVQTCAWYRRFIPSFADVAKPLTNLMKKNAKWTWESSQKSAFEILKRLLTSAPILRQADEAKPFTLNTDASDYAIGVLC